MINGGTNNANWGEDVDKAYDQMNSILQRIWTVDDGVMAKTCIILSTLLPTSDRKGMVNRITMNEQYRRLVRDHQDERCIYLADMEPPGEGADYISVNGDYWDDDPKVHPNVSCHPGRNVDCALKLILGRGTQEDGIRILRRHS